ncbi:hypothetical protein DY000_02026067 [Brassica cretica]|uniref:Uncharacterized protein n=1 Tax=Brassica cretica TaxID=69181 RepID=A0ABQ7E841_BRACR|nr:hypothetical protein DY000_02026067 [Brassica cretica]
MSLLYVIVAFVFFASILIARKAKKKTMNLPPGPPKLPIIGNLHQLGSQPHRSLTKLSEKYGPLMSLKFGKVSTVVASTPETVKDVLKTFDVDCCSRPYLTYPARITYGLNDIAFSPYSNYWREVRKVAVVELFTGKRVQSFRRSREEEVASFVDFVKQSASSENLVNFNQKLMKLSGSVTCRVGFGINLKGSKLENTYEEVIQGTMEVLGSFAAADSSRSLVNSSIGSQDESIKDDIIALLLKMERKETGHGEFQFTRNHTKGILLDILIGGIDTSAHTVTWVMTHLIANPRVMKKVQAEDKPAFATTNSKRGVKRLKIGGYDIPKKTWIQVNVWAIHRNPNIWKDPEVFIPERFMDKDIDYKGVNFELLPFGSGRRMCPGMNLGMALVHLTLINLLYRFDWKLPDGMDAKDVDLEESYGLVSPKKIPLELIPVITQWT